MLHSKGAIVCNNFPGSRLERGFKLVFLFKKKLIHISCILAATTRTAVCISCREIKLNLNQTRLAQD